MTQSHNQYDEWQKPEALRKITQNLFREKQFATKKIKKAEYKARYLKTESKQKLKEYSASRSSKQSQISKGKLSKYRQ